MSRIDVERYVQEVHARAGQGADPLALVAVAATVDDELAVAGDGVVDRFVHEAHQAGYSWTQIGEQLGISRQAARQRFAAGAMQLLQGDELDVLPRLRACLDRALDEGQEDGCAEIDSHYLLLGLLHVGVAASALDRLGVTPARVRDAMRTLFDVPAGGPVAQRPTLSADAQQAIEGASQLARDGGQSYLGTEHLLFCLATDQGSQARRVLNHLGVEVAAVKQELDGLVRTRVRRRRRRSGQSCSFCGRNAQTARLVAGSGACICQDCVQRAGAMLAQPHRSVI